MFRKSLSKVISITLSLALALVMLTSMATVNASALTMTYTPSAGYKNSIYYQNLTAVELTGDQATDIANVAISQLGYHEGNSTSDYGGTNINGSGNYTEYGRWIGNSTVKWCATFVSWCAAQAGIPTSTVAKQTWASKLTPSTTMGHFGNPYLKYSTHTPKVGDIAYFDNDGDAVTDHVEIVVAVDSTYIYTVGGNTSNCVKQHQINRASNLSNGFRIIGYESPNYATACTTAPTNVNLSISNDWYTVDDYIVFNISADSATSYKINLAKDGTTILTAPIAGTCKTTIRSLLNITGEPQDYNYGDYTIWLTATNTVGSTDSEVCNFMVIDEPTCEGIKCDSAFSYYGNVSITAKSQYATGHTIYIEDADGNTVVTSECDSSTFEISASELGVGDFTAYFDVYNTLGSLQTDRVAFTIYDTAPTSVTVTTDKLLYTKDESITLNFSSDYALNYCIKVINASGSICHMGSSSDSSYTMTLPVGSYSVSVNAYNPVGSVDAQTLEISVVATLGDVNGDGNLDYMDVLSLKKYVLDLDSNVTVQNADLNGDGIVNIVDYVELKVMLES